MGILKWIAGFLGWAAFGPIGGILGYIAGNMAEKSIDMLLPGGESPAAGGGPSRRSYSQQEQQNSFFVSLMVLSAAVIKADGRTVQAEIDTVKDFVRRNFGERAVPDAEILLNRILSQNISIYSVGGQIAANMNYSQRLQLFHYLTQIAIADGQFHKSEKSVLEAIASTIGLSSQDAASIIAMFYKDAESAYAVLEISPSASNDEVRSAYRRMAMKNHPDKVATLGPEVQKAAQEKFQKIQEAYEAIKRERGMA